eukprot:TRINITY_DN7792_c0_g1_i1.p1 TRINITY_DN7792_c0_g1~~TRINITY_DN7792_c0_g1_i1.p1  ORF type:complete len:428 (-),score=107.15 TRINITY_DN7792_c0_g1_i1:91-1374(-)
MLSSVSWISSDRVKQVPDRAVFVPDGELGVEPEEDLTMTPDDLEEDDKLNAIFGPPIKDTMHYKSNNEDPYLTNIPTEEDEDYVIKPTDLVLLAAVSEDEEVSHLDVYIYETLDENLYIHHDYLLPAFPLCVEPFSYNPGTSVDGNTGGNMVAVGTFEPYIEIWDLDVVDQPAPLGMLGGPEDPESLGTNKKVKLVKDSHRGAVLSLGWNNFQTNIMASASADRTVKLWDLANGSCFHTYKKIHTDKVQKVIWNPCEENILATAGFDKKLNLVDIRSQTPAMSAILGADAEDLIWLPAPHHNHILASDESGVVFCFDITAGLQRPLWRLEAHNGPCQALAINPTITGYLATGSTEGVSPVKLWDVSGGNPVILYSETADVGPVFSLQFAGVNPYVLAVGGMGKKPILIDTNKLGIGQHFEPTTQTDA